MTHRLFPAPLKVLIASLVTVVACANVIAQTAAAPPAAAFPSKTVTLVVPFTAGAGADALVRAAAKRLTELWKQPVVVENLPGADTIIGTRRVAKAPADGHTLLVTTPALLFIKFNHPQESEIVSELSPVGQMAVARSALGVTGKINVHSAAELRTHCLKPDAKCSWGSGDLSMSMVGSALMEKLGLSNAVAEVRYKGANAAINDLIGGHLTMLVGGSSIMAPHHPAAVQIVSIAGDTRSSDLPGVPTYKEAGFGAVDAEMIWVSVLAPKGTPDAVRNAIATGLTEVAKDKSVLTSMSSMQMYPAIQGPKEFGGTLKRDESSVNTMMQKTSK